MDECLDNICRNIVSDLSCQIFSRDLQIDVKRIDDNINNIISLTKASKLLENSRGKFTAWVKAPAGENEVILPLKHFCPKYLKQSACHEIQFRPKILGEA